MSYYIAGIILILGLSILYFDLFKKVSYKVKCAVALKKSYSAKNIMINAEENLAEKLKDKIKISEDTQQNLRMILRSATSNINEKDYISKLIAKSVLLSLFCGVISLPLIFNLPLYLLLSIGFGVGFFFYSIKKEKKKYQEYKRKIEDDLPKLCSVIASRLQSTSIVPDILKAFIPIANPQMKSELKTTLNDINMSSVESALLRFENRISSSKLSEIIRGLISVSRGNEQILYFSVKQAQFNDDYKILRRQDIKKRPFKLMPAFLVLAVIFIITIFYPLVLVLQNNNIF